MDTYTCEFCEQDLLETGETMDQHITVCEPYRREMFPEEFNHESPLCDGDEE
jgi:hypothetical protein